MNVKTLVSPAKAALLSAFAHSIICISCGGAKVQASSEPHRLTASIIPSGFEDSHDSYNAVSTASNGNIYYVLSSDKPDLAAQMFVYDPAANKSRRVGDLNQASGEADLHAIAQGKSHVSFVEANGKLYFATHIGFYTIIDGMEKPGIPPQGMKPYPGGHFLAYDMATGKYQSLGVAPGNEGIITFAMDTHRKRLY